MLLNLLKSKQPVTLVIIFLFTLLLWLNPFASQHMLFDDSMNQMPLFLLSKMILPHGSVASKIVGLAFIITIALLIIRLNIKFNFFAERSYLPAIIFVTLVVGVANVHDYYAFMPATILVIFTVDKLLQTYKTDSLSYKIFDAAFILGIASLFYLNAIFYMVFIWIALLLLRPFYWREWFFSLLGISIPFFITGSVYYLVGWHFPSIRIDFSNRIFSLDQYQFSLVQYLFLGAIFILMVIGSQFLMRSLGNKKIFTRKSFNLFLVLFLISLAMFFLLKTVSSDIMGIAAISLTILISHYFLHAKNTRWMNILFYLYLSTFLLTQLIPF
jgi:hypothetical protein